MEGLIQFTGIVMIAFGILQIILFFKIWGMTNNVKRIWKKIDNKDFLSDACVSYIKGNLEETERLANEAFLQEVALLSKSSESYEDWIDNYIKIKEKYTRIFKKIDKPAIHITYSNNTPSSTLYTPHYTDDAPIPSTTLLSHTPDWKKKKQSAYVLEYRRA